MERLSTLNWNGVVIREDDNYFLFSIDPIILSYYANIKDGMIVMDLGTGMGIIPLLIWGRAMDVKIVGIDIIEENVNLAVRNVLDNGLADDIAIDLCDIRVAKDIYVNNSFDLILSNPPYIPVDCGRVSSNRIKAISKMEICCNLTDVLSCAGFLLKNHGRLSMIYPADRFNEVRLLGETYNMAVSAVRYIKVNSAVKPKLMVIDLVKSTICNIDVLPPLIIYDEQGNYSADMVRIYEGDFGGK